MCQAAKVFSDASSLTTTGRPLAFSTRQSLCGLPLEVSWILSGRKLSVVNVPKIKVACPYGPSSFWPLFQVAEFKRFELNSAIKRLEVSGGGCGSAV
jgi:hypothetical protein